MNNPIKKADMEALAAYQKQLYKRPKLTFLFFELTDKCNLNCVHCGSRCSGANSEFLPYEMTEKVMRQVALAYDPRQIMICLTGGEPLLHRDILKIVSLASSLGFAVGMTTNGTLIDQATAYGLAHAGIDTITVSLDGIGEDHDEFRLSGGSFQKAEEGIKALKSAGIEPQVLTVAHKANLSKLDEIYNFLCELDIYSWRITNVDPIGRATANENLLLDAKEMLTLLKYIRNKRYDSNCNMDVTYGCAHFLTDKLEREVRDFYFQCGAGTQVASVMANGNIGACLDIERREDLIQGNVYTDDFIAVWESKFHQFRTDRTEKSKTCSKCEYKNLCLGDSAHTWDYDSNEPRYCIKNWRG